MILAIVIFLSPSGPIATRSVAQAYASSADCHAALSVLAPLIDMDRARLSALRGHPVEVAAWCHDLGRPA